MLQPIVRLQPDLDAKAVPCFRLPLVSLLTWLSIVLVILFRTFLAVAGLAACMAASRTSLSNVLSCLVELDLAVLADEGVRALRLWWDIV